MCLECQALLLEVDLVVLSWKQIPVQKDVAVPHVLYGLLAFQILLPMFIDIPYSCLLVVVADHCAILQPQWNWGWNGWNGWSGWNSWNGQDGWDHWNGWLSRRNI